MSKPTANWEKVGDRFYRKVQLYTAVFDQDLELENYLIAGAPYSGAVSRQFTPNSEEHLLRDGVQWR
jgi:vacuolar protein sorting-associated protein 16